MLIERVYVYLRKTELCYKVVSVDLYSLSVEFYGSLKSAFIMLHLTNN